MKLDDMRQKFLDFYQSKNHQIIKSSPLIPHNDPSLLFTNSGMVQFKNIFTGDEKSIFPRAATSQKCIRAGGKHNDLENVGYTARHHTFFEMLGNFSFGDYFKEEAIQLAWEYVNTILELDKSKLYITVYQEDEEAYNLWKKIAGFSEDKIIRISTNDNFWMMGDVGPCGPCSEIFYDLGDEVEGGPPGSANADGDRFIEFWNLVFMQFESLKTGERILLPRPSIDTGMGLERITAIMQGVKSNYETDLFKSLIESISDIGKLKITKENIASFRVIADHLRSCAFLITDGILPSNEGRGYVLRRIMRRAMRHINQLGNKEPLMHLLVKPLCDLMGHHYLELNQASASIKEILLAEEIRFQETLDKGLKLLLNESSDLRPGDILKGEVAFKLYDTYGFPFDLTNDILKAKQIQVDEQGFNTAMAKQKELAKKSWSGSGETVIEDVYHEIINEHGSTIFTGYQLSTTKAKVIALIKDGQLVKEINEGDSFFLITDVTPFYGESGGQVGDSGKFTSQNAQIQVSDTKKILGKIHSHYSMLQQGKLSLGDEIIGEIDLDRRSSIKRNHSATHLLHAALRKILGAHVTQKGSIVMPERLRFDISHPKAVSPEEMERIEDEVNEEIMRNTPSFIHQMKMDEAIKKGALALFSEKYEDNVRVISLGGNEDKHFSIELCGGTHVTTTGDIGAFKIISESAIASGVRRIEAITGKEAIKLMQKQFKLTKNLCDTLKCSNDDIVLKVSELLNEKKNLQNEVKKLKQASLSDDSRIEIKVKDVNLIYRIIENDAKSARQLTEQDRQKNKHSIIVTINRENDKVSMVIAISDDLTSQYDASKFIQKAIPIIGGVGGGGRPSLAQGGGNDFTKAEEAIELIKSMI
jgi:alanyl-tRNA synthetase